MPYIIAHRGASHDAPENTLSAFELAWEQGADGIEGDFMLTGDGHVVCFHDADTQRLSGMHHIVKESTLAELRTVDVGRWKGTEWTGTTIPTLEQVLQIIPPGKKFVAELKDGPEVVELFARAVNQSSLDPADILVITLNDETAAECHCQLSHLKHHWLSGYERAANGAWQPTAADVIAKIKQFNADGFGSQSKPDHFDAAFIAELRAAGIDEFHVWTVDEPAIAKFYAQLGPWGITTNRPGVIRHALCE
jgi:glycerophosphoryl diester phosphodiesterase